MPIVLRSVKGSALSHAELDGNFNDLVAADATKSDTGHTHTAAFITDFSEAVDDRVAALLVAGTNITLSYNDATGQLTISAAGGGGATNLTYTAATRVLASDTGSDATLPLVTSGDAGLAPASGGGTTNFLRADGTWAAPAGGGAAVDDPVTLTGNTTLTWPDAQGKYYSVNSASAVALTLPSGVGTNAVKIVGLNVGAGALSFVAGGGESILANAILPSTVDQYSPFELRRFGSAWVRVA